MVSEGFTTCYSQYREFVWYSGQNLAPSETKVMHDCLLLRHKLVSHRQLSVLCNLCLWVAIIHVAFSINVKVYSTHVIFRNLAILCDRGWLNLHLPNNIYFFIRHDPLIFGLGASTA